MCFLMDSAIGNTASYAADSYSVPPDAAIERAERYLASATDDEYATRNYTRVSEGSGEGLRSTGRGLGTVYWLAYE